MTIHDLRPYFFPDTFVQKFYFRHMLPRSLKRCDGVLTVSGTTKRLLTRTYSIPEHQVFVVPNSINLDEFRPTQRSSSSDPYLLMVGCTLRHKNVEEVLQVADLWRNRYTLKLIAGEGPYKRKLRRLVSERNLVPHVDFLENVSRSDLVSLYQNCSALLYPSFMEGFGIPPLEAMACGRPVIVSDIPIFHELYYDVPFYVSLGNLESWKAAFEALRDSGLERRLQRGLQVSAEYSEDRMCSALTSALKSIWGLNG